MNALIPIQADHSLLQPESIFNVEDFENKEMAEELVCGICKNIPHYSCMVQHKCAAIFCLICAETWKREKEECPICRGDWPEGKSKTVSEKNKAFLRMIMKLTIKCTNPPSRTAKCLWVGKWEELDSHLKECEWKKIKCPLDCGVIESMCDMEEHLTKDCLMRKIQCPDCKKLVKVTDTNHLEFCFANPSVISVFVNIEDELKVVPVKLSESVDSLRRRIIENFCTMDLKIDDVIIMIEGLGKTLNDGILLSEYEIHQNSRLLVKFIYPPPPKQEEKKEAKEIKEEESRQEEEKRHEFIENLLFYIDFFEESKNQDQHRSSSLHSENVNSEEENNENIIEDYNENIIEDYNENIIEHHQSIGNIHESEFGNNTSKISFHSLR